MHLNFNFLGQYALVAAVLAGCTASEQGPEPDREQPALVRYVPGGSNHKTSPLALLMRDMTVFCDSTGKALAHGRGLLPYPATFNAILTAEPTPGMVDHGTFDPFALAWLQQLDSLYSTPEAQRSKVFNGLVQRCANCHGEVCPGPLSRINKLRIAPGH